MVRTFWSTDPLTSTDDKYKYYRMCGCVESLSLSKTSALKMQMIPPLLLPRPRAPPCCIFTLPLGEQIAFFFNQDCMTSRGLPSCPSSLEVGVVALRNEDTSTLVETWVETGVKEFVDERLPPLIDVDDALDHGALDGPNLGWRK